MPKGSDLLVAALENEGVDRIFGVPGEENLDVVESLRNSSIKLILTHENGALMGRWDPAPFPEWDRFYLIAISPDTFIPGFLEQGKLYDVERDMVFEFKAEGGRAMEFKVRGEKDQVMATGKRAN